MHARDKNGWGYECSDYPHREGLPEELDWHSRSRAAVLEQLATLMRNPAAIDGALAENRPAAVSGRLRRYGRSWGNCQAAKALGRRVRVGKVDLDTYAARTTTVMDQQRKLLDRLRVLESVDAEARTQSTASVVPGVRGDSAG